MKPLDEMHPHDIPSNASLRTQPFSLDRAIKLATRLVHEQEQRVASLGEQGRERRTAEALLATLRASLALCYRCQLMAGGDGLPPERQETARRLTSSDPHAVLEEERKRIAQELHDDLGQRLSALGLSARRLELLAGAAEHSSPLGVAIRELQAQIDSTLVSIKRMTWQLRPLALEALGFLGALEWLVAEFASRTNIRVAYRPRLDGLAVSSTAATAIYRIVQEALTNITRHAWASTVTIDLFCDGDICVLRIADDGVGTSLDEANSKHSLGLSGIAERVIQLQGTLSIHSATHAGFAIVARLPVTAIAPAG